jgi:hypothetical protein
MGFFNQIEGPVKQVINDIINDPGLNQGITYRKFAGQEFSESHGHNVDTYEEYSVTTVQLRHNQRSVKEATANVEAGDPLFLFRYADLPDGVSLKDQIVSAEGATMKVKDISKIFGLAISITVEGP